VSSAPDGVSGKGRRRCLEGPNAVAVKNELLGEREVRESLTGNVRLVIGAAEVGDLGGDTPEGGSAWARCRKGHRYTGGDDRALRMAVHRFPLSFREVEEFMLVRGAIVSFETRQATAPGHATKAYCVLSAVAILLDRKISYTSKKRPSPIATTTLRCVGPIEGGRGAGRCRSVSPGARLGRVGPYSLQLSSNWTQRLVSQTDGLPPIHRSRRSSALRYALVEGLGHVRCNPPPTPLCFLPVLSRRCAGQRARTAARVNG
jgi:hypothetical protein